jgi:hypothetical protein
VTDDTTVGFTAGSGGWTYHWAHRRKPHLHPVATPAGHVLTRVEPPDHPWQRGLWFSVKFVDGDNFWEEGLDKWGVIRHDGPPEVSYHDDGGGAVEGDLVWIRSDRESVALRERRRWTHVPIDGASYAIDLDTTLVAPEGAVLDRSPFSGLWGGYSGLTLRGRNDWRDTRLLFDDGTRTDRVTPHPARWCDITGTIDVGDGDGEGEATVGMALLDHPGNLRHPPPFYASSKAPDYGDEGWTNFVNPAFLWHGPHTLAPGEALRLRYRVVVHDGELDGASLDDTWRRWSGA